MSFLNKLGIGIGSSEGVRREVTGPIHLAGRPHTPGAGSPAAGAARAPVQEESNRPSNALQELLGNLDGFERGTLLDLGPAWQITLSLFIDRGFRASAEDLLRPWQQCLC